MAFGTDESVLFREVSLIIEGVLIERFHCICIATIEHSTTSAVQSSLLSHVARTTIRPANLAPTTKYSTMCSFLVAIDTSILYLHSMFVKPSKHFVLTDILLSTLTIYLESLHLFSQSIIWCHPVCWTHHSIHYP